MDDVIIRSRYPRHASYGRRRRKSTRESDGLNKTLFRQFVISAVILVLIMLIDMIHTPSTIYISGKVKEALSQSIDLSSLYSGVKDFLGITSAQTASENNESSESSESTAVTVSSSLKGLTLIKPAEGVISSSFGKRTDPLTKTEQTHYGIDIEAATGTSIKAILDGVTAETGSSKTYGNYVKLDHGNGLCTIYAHCSKILTAKGQKIKQGDVIAEAGSTGRSVGSHLHFEIWKDKTALDPLDYMDYQSGSTSQAQGLQ